MQPKRIAIFASGSGSNALKILSHFDNDSNVEVSVIISNKIEAGVKAHANKYEVPFLTHTRDELNSGKVLLELKELNIDWIILAGYLLLIPKEIISNYSDKIINIHPSLLPNYGGKGMYGMNVHRAVIENKEKVSGITIHLVNEEYDKGEILAQYSCEIAPSDTPESLAKKIQKLEHANFPAVIERTIKSH